MKILAFSAGAWLSIAAIGYAGNIKPPLYESRYKNWLPYIMDSVIVDIFIGGKDVPSRGLWSAAFSASPNVLREPEAMRPNGTFVTGYAHITEEEMTAMLKVIDSLSKSATFSTRGDKDPQTPEQARIGVLWRGGNVDWYVPAPGRMGEALKHLRETLVGKEAIDVIEGLIDGHNQRR